MSDAAQQSPTPSQGPQGSDLKTAAADIESLLDNEGHFNPDGQMSRAHPDYDESSDPRAGGRKRDARGRYKKDDDEELQNAAQDDDSQSAQLSDDQNEDTDDVGDTNDDLAASTVDDDVTDDDGDTATIESLSDLAESLEVSIDDLSAQVKHTFTAAGEEVTVSLAELVNGYQKDVDYRRNTERLTEERQTLNREAQSRMQEFQAHNHALAQGFQFTEQMIAGEMDSPEMQNLQVSNREEWLYRRQMLGERLDKLRGERAKFAQRYSEYVQTTHNNLRTAEQAALLKAKPDFTDADKTIAQQTIGSLGFNEQEVAEVIDHRLVIGALELHRLREENAALRKLKEEGERAAKKLKTDLPKANKPGRQQQNRGVRVTKDRMNRLRQRAKKSGSVDDAAAVIENMMN
jgi:hypothetical protein